MTEVTTLNLSGEFSLRELNKAKSKIAFYEAALLLIEDKMFGDLMLNDICKSAGLSRVTFFKFFKHKDDLLIYYMRIWLTERIIEISLEHKRGFTAVRHLLGKVVEQTNTNKGLMPSLISFLAGKNMHPDMPELSPAEVALLFPGHQDIASRKPNMLAFFHQCITEAEQDGQLKPLLTVEVCVQLLFTIFYGAFLTGQIYGTSDLAVVYETHLQVIYDRI